MSENHAMHQLKHLGQGQQSLSIVGDPEDVIAQSVSDHSRIYAYMSVLY